MAKPAQGEPGNRSVIRGRVNFFSAPVGLEDCPHPSAPRHIWLRYAIERERAGERMPVAIAHPSEFDRLEVDG